MATFTIDGPVNVLLGAFEFQIDAGSIGSCPDDLYDELKAAVEASYGNRRVVTRLTWDRGSGISSPLSDSTPTDVVYGVAAGAGAGDAASRDDHTHGLNLGGRIVPAGGTTGQALVKASATDFDTEWGAAVGGSTSPLAAKGQLWGYSTADAAVPAPGADGKILVSDAAQAVGMAWVDSATGGQTSTVEVLIDGGGSPITSGLKAYFEVPIACTLVAARVVGDRAGDAVIDIWKDTFANFPPTDADSITSATPLTLSSAQSAQNTTLSGWTTSVNAGDWLAVNVDSAATVTTLTLSLTFRRDYWDVAHASPLMTKGDLFVFSSVDTRLAAGADGKFLKANSATATGLEWADVPAGAAALNDLTDVTITTPSNGDVLTYDTGTGEWKNAAAGGGSPSGTVANETTWGISPSAGSAAAYSRGDHTHGTPADPGSGGFTTSYLGYNTVGGSTLSLTGDRMYAKQITTTGAVTLLGIEAYLNQSADNTGGLSFALWTDDTNTVGRLLAVAACSTVYLGGNAGAGGTYPSRWFGNALNYPLAASTTYWIGFMNTGGAGYQIKYDASGTDRSVTCAVAGLVSDGERGTQANTTYKLSIRALVA